MKGKKKGREGERKERERIGEGVAERRIQDGLIETHCGTTWQQHL